MSVTLNGVRRVAVVDVRYNEDGTHTVTIDGVSVDEYAERNRADWIAHYKSVKTLVPDWYDISQFGW